MKSEKVMEQEIFYTMALTRLTNFNYQQALELYRSVGSAQLLYEHRNEIGDIIQEASTRLKEALKNWGDAMKRAEFEMNYIQEHHIKALTLNNEDYPQRLRECPDAPIIIYYLGNSDLNQAKIVSIRYCPQVLIVSGLAYGVDIHAHRQALENGYETIGVLAHGLDQIYPYRHRETAAAMVSHGGLLTEFMTQTNADKPNFVRRNRIVAGMADATILVESAAKGGGLITTEIAQSYDRAVFAFPGNVGAEFSEGCNNLIRDNGAALITCAEDFVRAMGWQNEAQLQQALNEGIERNLFPELTPEEQQVVNLLQKTNDLQLNILSVKSALPIGQLTALLFQLEMKGIIKPLAGGMYHLLM